MSEGVELWTVAQMAETLQCSERTVQNKVRSGAWPHKKFGPRIIRFTQEHVEQILDAAEVQVSREKEKPRRIKDLVSRLQ